MDRTHIDIPPSHHKLISEVARAQKNSVVVLTNGSAIAMPWLSEVPAVVETWLGGQAGAGAMADVLFGKSQSRRESWRRPFRNGWRIHRPS